MSRFSDEIARQHEALQNISNLYIAQALISLPADDQIAPDHFRLASHENAFNRIKPPPPFIQDPILLWDTTNQKDLLASQSTPPRSMEELLKGLIACKFGKPINRRPVSNTDNSGAPLLEQVQQELHKIEYRPNLEEKVKNKRKNKKTFEKMAILVLEGDGEFGTAAQEEQTGQHE